MLTLLADLSYLYSPLNIFRYITFRAAMGAATALFFVFFFGPGVIAALRIKQGKGQPIREDGPASHLVTKKGTPTMGGLMILSGLVAATLLWANLRNAYVWIVLFVTVGFGLIGFYDDYLKVTKQSHAGFAGKVRLALEFLIAGLACYALMHSGGENMTKLAIPMVKGYVATLGPYFILFGAFVIVSAGNCVNLTDGLDGLAIVPSMIAAGAFAIVVEGVETFEEALVEPGAHEDRIGKMKDRAAQLKTNQEYQAHLFEVELANKKRGEFEEKILLAMEQIEQTQRTIAAAEVQLKESEALFVREKTILDEKDQALTAELAELIRIIPVKLRWK